MAFEDGEEGRDLDGEQAIDAVFDELLNDFRISDKLFEFSRFIIGSIKLCIIAGAFGEFFVEVFLFEIGLIVEGSFVDGHRIIF